MPMTDDYSAFFDDVHHRLQATYGGDAVDVRPTLPETDRSPDFRIRAPLCRFLVFIALDVEEALGVASTVQLCAAHDRHGVPMVVVPGRLLEMPELDLLAQRTPVVLTGHEPGDEYS